MKKDVIIELMGLLESVRTKHAKENSEYLQGKKDGLRTALAIVSGDPAWIDETMEARMIRRKAQRKESLSNLRD